MRSLRHALVLTFATLTATAALPATAATADMSCPSMAGSLLTRPGYPWYLVDMAGNLRGLPPGVPDRLFTNTAHLRTDVPLEICGAGEDLSQDAMIVTAGDHVRPWFLYTNGKKYGIPPGGPEKYHFDRAKLQLIPARVLDAIPDGIGGWG